MFYWWTVSLCLIAGGRKKNKQKYKKKHVTAAGLCLSLYLATLEAKRGSLYFLGYCMLVALFYQLFMKKCERDILTEIKKEHIMKSYSQTLSRTFLLLMLHAKRRISVYIRLEGVTWTWHQGAILVSWMRACARVSEWVRACVRRISGGGGAERVRELLGRERRGVKTGMWVMHLLSASPVSLRLL